MNENDKKPNAPKFNVSWIYIVILVTIGILFFTTGNGEKQGGIKLLRELGLKEGDTVRIEDFEFEFTED